MADLASLITDLGTSLKKLYDKECIDTWLFKPTFTNILNGDNLKLDFEPDLTTVNDIPEDLAEKINDVKDAVKLVLKSQWESFAQSLKNYYDANKATSKDKDGNDVTQTAKAFFEENLAGLGLAGSIAAIAGITPIKLGDITDIYQRTLDSMLTAIIGVSGNGKGKLTYVTVSSADFIKYYDLNGDFEPKISEDIPKKAFYENELKKQWGNFVYQLAAYYLGNRLKGELAVDTFRWKAEGNIIYLDQAIHYNWSKRSHNLDTLLESHENMLRERLKIIVTELVIGVGNEYASLFTEEKK